MNQNDYEKWAEVVRQWQLERERINQKVRCIRISNDRNAKEATFEDRLTDGDRLFLKEMGIAL
jgi:hypothetical protein